MPLRVQERSRAKRMLPRDHSDRILYHRLVLLRIDTRSMAQHMFFLSMYTREPVLRRHVRRAAPAIHPDTGPMTSITQ